MIRTALVNVRSRWARLITKLKNDRFRDAYLDKTVKAYLANQVRALRGDRSQQEFGKIIGATQSVVSRLEDEGYGKLNTQTLIDIAKKLRVALVIKFVDYPTFLTETSDLSAVALVPKPYSDKQFESKGTLTTGSTSSADVEWIGPNPQTRILADVIVKPLETISELVEAQ